MKRHLNDQHGPCRSRTPRYAKQHRAARQRPRRAGITLVETVLSLLIIAGAFVASLNSIAGARASQAVAAQQRLGLVLAEDMMAEVLSKPYREDGGLFGPEADEQTGDRLAFDDIDDYSGWQSSPPAGTDGAAIDGAGGYTRLVAVAYAKLSDPASETASDEGLLKITVTVRHGSKTAAELVAYRSDLYESTGVGY